MLPVEEAIIEKLRSGPCSLDDVVTHLSSFSTGEIFVTIDRMSWDRDACCSANAGTRLFSFP